MFFSYLLSGTSLFQFIYLLFSSDMFIYHLVFGPMYAASWEFLVATFLPG